MKAAWEVRHALDDEAKLAGDEWRTVASLDTREGVATSPVHWCTQCHDPVLTEVRWSGRGGGGGLTFAGWKGEAQMPGA